MQPSLAGFGSLTCALGSRSIMREVIAGELAPRLLPGSPATCPPPPGTCAVVHACCQHAAEQRPPMGEVAARLTTLFSLGLGMPGSHFEPALVGWVWG